ncbi:hypothetical protein [Streptomyces sp. NPDC088246]|uniref:hypothetical protein n=1 Tax=Streptomyces sp. NPDC088246 TaxID=3365842 RepID=UPI00382FB728
MLFAVTVWLLADNVLAAGIAFLGSLFGLVVGTGVLAARHAEMGAPPGPRIVTVGDSGDAVRFAGAHMETRRGRRSLGGHMQTAAGFVLPTPPPYLLVVHYLPKRAIGRGDTDRLRGVLDRRRPRHGGRPPRH